MTHSQLPADLILISHVIYVSIVVLSVPMIALGGVFGWRWIRRRTFRLTHILMIAVVVIEAFFNVPCPLTTLEQELRHSGIQRDMPARDFIAFWLDRLLFWHFPHWIFVCVYAMFAAIVLGLAHYVPWTKLKKTPSASYGKG